MNDVQTIAALYVATGGCYFGLAGVDPWDVRRDARLYAGPHPVIAHPPCERWGRYWFGGPSAKVRRTKGDDGGCFASALASVRKWSGVLEHPEATAAWAAFGLAAPPKTGGWIMADFDGGWTCCVEQGHYGHGARKATWLYVNGITPPLLRWGCATSKLALPTGATWVPCECCPEFWCVIHDQHAFECECPAIEEWATDPYAGPVRGRGERSPNDAIERLSKKQRAATPFEFRDLLLSMARTPMRRAA